MKITEWNDGDYPVLWEKIGKSHIITYGNEVTTRDDDIAAAHAFGECIRHSIECAGKLN